MLQHRRQQQRSLNQSGRRQKAEKNSWGSTLHELQIPCTGSNVYDMIRGFYSITCISKKCTMRFANKKKFWRLCTLSCYVYHTIGQTNRITIDNIDGLVIFLYFRLSFVAYRLFSRDFSIPFKSV